MAYNDDDLWAEFAESGAYDEGQDYEDWVEAQLIEDEDEALEDIEMMGVDIEFNGDDPKC